MSSQLFGDPAHDPADEARYESHREADPDRPAEQQPAGRRPGHRRRRRRVSGCLPLLVVLALIVGLGYVGVSRGVSFLESRFGAPEDFSGAGTGAVTFEVVSGDSISRIGTNLTEAGVVASAGAFRSAASGDPAASGIQPGFYEMREQMSAEAALAILIDPANREVNAITVPEGLRAVEVLDLLAEQTEFGRGAFRRALDDAEALGLPAYAGGEAEGYLFPATYPFGPNDTPATMLRAMVDRWRQSAESLSLEQRAAQLGYDPHEIMTIASLVEAEGRGDDMPRIARVIYNRLENPNNGITNGVLGIDATVNYALGRNLGLQISAEDLQVDSPYNTRRFAGLPPGPIEAPGEDALSAALEPADGDWLFYVTVNPNTGETVFTADPDEFSRLAQQFRDFCADNPGTC